MIYVKQYGAAKCGTNYIKWLLQKNWKQVRVLSEILGSRHGPHVEPIDWSGKGWIPKEKGIPRLVEAVTPGIRQAYESGELWYIVIAKDPYAYCYSHAKRVKEEERNEIIRLRMEEWNEVYQSWSQLLDNKPEKAILVRHGDLLFNLSEEMHKIADWLGVPRLEKYANTNKQIGKSNDFTWNGRVRSRSAGVDAFFFKKNQHLVFLGQEKVELITELADKELMKRLKYEIATLPLLRTNSLQTLG